MTSNEISPPYTCLFSDDEMKKVTQEINDMVALEREEKERLRREKDPQKTPEAELEKYRTLIRNDGVQYLVHEDDLAKFLALPNDKTQKMQLRCLDGFTVGAIKMYDGSIYLPNCIYRGEE